jgi:pyruvate kinase
MKLTKIVSTIGPVSDSIESIEGLIKAGVNVFRLNFKHGDPAEHEERVRRIREVAARMQSPISIMMDLQGPSFRLILSTPTIELKKGIYKTTFQIVPPTGRQKLDQEVLLSKELLTSDPNEIHKILFTGKIPHSFVLSMNSYEEVYRMMKSDNFKFKELLPQIFHKFYTRLTKEKLEVPEEIIKELQLDLFIEV